MEEENINHRKGCFTVENGMNLRKVETVAATIGAVMIAAGAGWLINAIFSWEVSRSAIVVSLSLIIGFTSYSVIQDTIYFHKYDKDGKQR